MAEETRRLAGRGPGFAKPLLRTLLTDPGDTARRLFRDHGADPATIQADLDDMSGG